MAILVRRFERWLAQAQRGDEYIYHRGRLAADRFTYDVKSGENVPSEIDALAKLAWEAYERHEVVLFQKPSGDGTFICTARCIKCDPAALKIKTQAMRGAVYGRPAQRVFSVPMSAAKKDKDNESVSSKP